MEITAKCIEFDKPNASGIVYSKEALENAVAEMQESVKEGKCLMHLNSGNDFIDYESNVVGTIGLTHAIGKINKVWCENGTVMVNAITCRTPDGIIVENILKRDSKMLKPAIVGTLDHNTGRIDISSIDLCAADRCGFAGAEIVSVDDNKDN